MFLHQEIVSKVSTLTYSRRGFSKIKRWDTAPGLSYVQLLSTFSLKNTNEQQLI